MKRAEIRKAVADRLAALGYPREWYEWPKHKPGWCYLLLPSGNLTTLHLPAPCTKGKFRQALAAIPRRGPALVYRRATRDSWRQPDLEAIWARPRDGTLQQIDVRGHMGEAIDPPQLGDKNDKGGRR